MSFKYDILNIKNNSLLTIRVKFTELTPTIEILAFLLVIYLFNLEIRIIIKINIIILINNSKITKSI